MARRRKRAPGRHPLGSERDGRGPAPHRHSQSLRLAALSLFLLICSNATGSQEPTAEEDPLAPFLERDEWRQWIERVEHIEDDASEARTEVFEDLLLRIEVALVAEADAEANLPLEDAYALLERALVALERAPATDGSGEALLRAHALAANLMERRVEREPQAAAQHASRSAWHRYVEAIRRRRAGDGRGAIEALEQGLAMLPKTGVEAFDLQVFRAELLRSVGEEGLALDATQSALTIRDALETSWEADSSAHERRARIAGIRAQVLVELGLPERAGPWIREERDETAAGIAARGLNDEDVLVRAWRASWIHEGNWLLAQQRYAAALRFVADPLRRLNGALARAGDDARRRSGYEGARAELELVRCFAEGRLADERESDLAEVIEALLLLSESPTTSPRSRMPIALRGAEFAFRADDRSAARRFAENLRTSLDALGETGAQSKERAMVHAVELGICRRTGGSPEELRERLERALASFAAFLSEWESLPQRNGGLGFLHAGHRRFYLGELLASVLELEGPERALDLLARSQRTGRPELRAEGGLALFRQRVLGPGEGALVYLPAPGSGHVFAFDRDSVVHATLRDDVALRKRARVVLGALQSGSLDASFRSESAALASELFPASIRAVLGHWTAVTIIGGDLLGDVPFDALPNREGEPLGHSLAISHLPSLSAGLALAARSGAAAPRDYTVLAAAEAAAAVRTRWPEVGEPGVLESELEPLLAHFDRGRRVQHLAGEATWTNLSTAENSAVLQLLIHGVVDHRRELSATLVFSPTPDDEGLVRVEEVLALERAPDCVLLTTCHSAAGPARPGEDVSARLAGAFLARGSRVVLEALGSLDVAPTLALSDVLLRELSTGATPARALQRARAALGNDDANVARIRLVGLGHAPSRVREATVSTPKREGLQRSTLVLAMLGCAAFGAWIALRRRA